MEQVRWLLLSYVLASERIFLKRNLVEIAVELISLFCVQIQEPTSMSTTTRPFVFLTKFLKFYYRKYEIRSL